MAVSTAIDLERRVAELEAENAALRTAVRAEPPLPPPPSPVQRRPWGWALLSTVLVLIGVSLAPVTIVSTWAKAQLTEEDRFVTTFAPLADDPTVQQYVTQETMIIINSNVDIAALTSDVIDGIISLGTPQRATDALEALKAPAASGIQSLVESRIAQFVESDAFAQVWNTALGVSHRQVIAAMENDPNAALSFGPGGEIGIQLGPIIDAAQEVLVAQGFDFASRIPTINRTITVAQSDAIPTIQLGYSLALSAGLWLPWITLAFLTVGVVVARRKTIALIVTAIALALMMVLTALAFVIGHAVFVSSVSPESIPSGVADTLFARVVGGMQSTTVAVLTLAVVVALVGWFAGPFVGARTLRGFARDGAGGVRQLAEKHDVTTGRFGVWVYSQRALLRAAVAVVASLLIVFTRPLSPALIFWTLIGALVVLAAIELLQRPPVDVRDELREEANAERRADRLSDRPSDRRAEFEAAGQGGRAADVSRSDARAGDATGGEARAGDASGVGGAGTVSTGGGSATPVS